MKSMKQAVVALLLLLPLLCIPPLSAEGIHSVEGGILFYCFNYKETLPDKLKSTERGWLSGVTPGY